MSDERAKFGRVFDAAVGVDWAITEDGMRMILAVASRTNPIEAVEAYRSQPHEHAPSLKVRDGVGIIPVTGPISRYMTWFSLFSGGTSISALALSLQTALDDADVHSIMFEINSPGGEVTGVNEFAQAVLAARKKKPITARVGGLGCSAAYWIAAMCGDVVIDRTAQLGSIGVRAAYLDDRKALEMRGLAEIEFISSQSPHKNTPPYKTEGKKRIQARLDALAQVFIDSVAEGRGVSADVVAKEFGQGDVFVGQAAIDAGLADRLGSFEETLAQLAKTHTAGYTGPEPDEPEQPEDVSPFDDDDDDDFYGAEKTITDPISVNSQPVADEAEMTTLSAADDPEKNEEFMSDTKQDQATPKAEEQETAPGAAAEQPKAANTAADVAADQAGVKAPTTGDEVAAMRQQLADQAKELAEMKAAAEDKWLDETVAGFTASETAGAKTILSALVKAEGREGASVKAFIENQKALAAQIDESKLFGEVGKRGGNTDANSPEAQLEALAKKKASDDKVSYEKAYDAVMQENPELAAKVI